MRISQNKPNLLYDFKCLSVEGCRLPTTDTSEIDGPDADIPIDVNDPGLDVAVDRQIGALRRGSRTQAQLQSTGPTDETAVARPLVSIPAPLKSSASIEGEDCITLTIANC